MKHLQYPTLLSLVITFLFIPWSASAQSVFSILHPDAEARTSKVRVGAIVGSLQDDAVAALQLRVPYRTSIWLNATSKAQKDEFALAVKNMFPPSFTIGTAVFTTVSQAKRKETVKEYVFDDKQDIDLKKFWASAEFREMYATLHQKRLHTVRLEIQGWIAETISPSDENAHVAMAGYFFFFPDLEPGNNAFEVRAVDAAGAIVQAQTVTLYYENDYASGGPDDAETRSRFHAAIFPDECSGCHDVELPESAAGGGESVEDQCGSCHTPMQQQASSHFPVAAWDCISCHDAASEPAYALRADKDFDTEACFECHGGVEETVTTSPHIHFPATDRCMSCHDAHSSPQKALLVDDVFNICSSCHEDMATTPHPVVGHPLATVEKPSKPPREISCMSCHDAHGSQHASLLSTARKTLCKNCHNF